MQIIRKIDDNSIVAILSKNDIAILEMIKSKQVQSNVRLALEKLSNANRYLVQAVQDSMIFWNTAYPSKQSELRLVDLVVCPSPKKSKMGRKK